MNTFFTHYTEFGVVPIRHSERSYFRSNEYSALKHSVIWHVFHCLWSPYNIHCHKKASLENSYTWVFTSEQNWPWFLSSTDSKNLLSKTHLSGSTELRSHKIVKIHKIANQSNIIEKYQPKIIAFHICHYRPQGDSIYDPHHRSL